MSPRYLPTEAIALIGKYFQKNPEWGIAGTLALFGILTGLIRWRSGRGVWKEIVLLSFFSTAAVLFAAACLYLLHIHPSYRFLG
ncbi:MAG: hypothetical protein WC859_04750 [Elusimicrobiota bacterium]|jgi:hypothetical protein